MPATAVCPTERVDAEVIAKTRTSVAARYVRTHFARTLHAPLARALELERGVYAFALEEHARRLRAMARVLERGGADAAARAAAQGPACRSLMRDVDGFRRP